MKAKKIELNVDLIGGELPLTLAEEKALSDYFAKRKTISNKSSSSSKRKIKVTEWFFIKYAYGVKAKLSIYLQDIQQTFSFS